MTHQAFHQPYSLPLRYNELPSLQELLRQLDQPHACASADGKNRRWYSNPKFKEYLLPNLFPILYILAVLTWLLVVWLHPNVGRLSELAYDYGSPALQILFFLAMIQFM